MKFFLCVSFGVLALVSHVTLASTVVMSLSSGVSFDKKLDRLDFADEDSDRMAEALKKVGLVDESRVFRADALTTAELRTFLQSFLAQYSKPETVKKFIFYFSGHSDELGLHLKDGHWSRAELHNFLASVPAKTKVVILDSCFSGSLAMKGVREAEKFEIPRLHYDEPSGSIFLTATSATDIALESRTLKGSLFTHNLVAGLYGSADSDSDGVVTATELYQYAFKETQLQTQFVPIGRPQIPEFTAQLSGRGAVALSFPQFDYGQVTLAPELEGDIHIYSKKGLQFFRVQKTTADAKTLQLPAGDYQVAVQKGKLIAHHDVILAANSHIHVAADQLNWSAVTAAHFSAAKGARSRARQGPRLLPFIYGGEGDGITALGVSLGIESRVFGQGLEFSLGHRAAKSEAEGESGTLPATLAFKPQLLTGGGAAFSLLFGLGAQFAQLEGYWDVLPFGAVGFDFSFRDFKLAAWAEANRKRGMSWKHKAMPANSTFAGVGWLL